LAFNMMMVMMADGLLESIKYIATCHMCLQPIQNKSECCMDHTVWFYISCTAEMYSLEYTVQRGVSLSIVR